MIKFDKELNNLREYVIEAGDMILEALRICESLFNKWRYGDCKSSYR